MEHDHDVRLGRTDRLPETTPVRSEKIVSQVVASNSVPKLTISLVFKLPWVNKSSGDISTSMHPAM